MVRTAESIVPENHGDAAPDEPLRERYRKAFRWMLLARVLETKLASLYRGGKIHGGVFLGRGQEALSASIGMNLKPGDVFAPLIRDQAGRLAFGEPLVDAVRTYLGSRLGPMRGREGNVHRGRPREGLIPMISHLGAMISVVNGILMARRMQGRTGFVGATSVGDGATSTGAFHEALNQAAIERLPLVLVVADNQYAYSTHTSRQFACKDLVDKAAGYGIRGHSINGTILEDCLTVVSEAVRLARSGDGPQLVVARLLRLCGHGEHDDAAYVNPKLKSGPLGRDCLELAERDLGERNWATQRELEAWRREQAHAVEETVARVQREPAPDPYEEDWSAVSTRRMQDGFFNAQSGNPFP